LGPSGKRLHSGRVEPVHIKSLFSTSKLAGFESLPSQKQACRGYCCQRKESDTEISNRDLLFDSTDACECSTVVPNILRRASPLCVEL
jgi:hypothetical protein